MELLFTVAEKMIIELLVDGHNTESVSHQLAIHQSTVKRHLSNITKKLCVNSASELIVWYYKTHWVKATELEAKNKTAALHWSTNLAKIAKIAKKETESLAQAS